MHVQSKTIAIAAALISGITLAATPIASDVADATPKKTYCDTTIADTTIEGDVIVVENPDSQKYCVLRNVRVTGNVEVSESSDVEIVSFSQIEGDVSSSLYSYVQILDSRVGGTVSARGGFAYIFKSRISGDATISGNFAAEVAKSHFSSNLEIDSNHRAEVVRNTVDGKLSGQNWETTREKNRARGGATGNFGGPDGTYRWDDCPGNNCEED